MFNIFRKLEIFVIVVIVAVIGIIYAFKQKPVVPTTNLAVNSQLSTQPSLDTIPASQVPATTIVYPGQDGKNALELLKAGHQVVATHYSFGDMVTGIDGIAPDKDHFWAMYVNDQFSQVGASAYVTKSTDTIKWQTDAVVDTTK